MRDHRPTHPLMRHAAAGLLLLALVVGVAGEARAASASPPGSPDAQLATMDDRAVREALRARLQAEADATRTGQPQTQTAATVETPLQEYARRLDEVADTYPRLPGMLADAFHRPNGTQPAMSPLRLGGALLILFAAGGAAMAVARRALRIRENTAPLLRLTAGLAEMVAFALGVLLSYAALRPAHPAAPAILLAVLQFALTVLLADRLLRVVTAPGMPEHRPLPLDEEAARGLHRTALTTVVLMAGMLGLFDLLRALGMPREGAVALGLPLGTLPFVYLLWEIWRHRAGVTEALAAPLNLDMRALPLLSAWPALATLYLLGLWVTVIAAALRLEHGTGLRLMASLLLAFGMPMVALLLTKPLARFYRAGLEDGEDAGPQLARLMRAAWLALMVLGVIGTAMIWGFDPERHTGPGVILLRVLFNVAVVLLIGYVGWVLMIRATDRALRATRREGASTRAQRMATLLPLLRKFLQVVLVAVLAMIVLSSMGIEIGPLLAGAGVVGIAIGLGAQSTIADILAGVFFLLEDAFHMGDYVEVGNLRGTVEGISLRSLKLRHHRGAIHTLPFGQIKALTNYTRDWALMRLEFRVPPDTDLSLVKKLVKDIGKELAADPEMGPNFLEPLKSQGVRRVEDDALIIGVKFISKPNEQFVIRREAYQRLIRAFNEHGIHLVGRGVVVRVDDPNAASTAIGFAAQEAVRRAAEDVSVGAR
ncbi:mechanosensitive ion channel domain-containing protein [Azospirillum soli]|uniref:mechanosensitive ion channel domain-containing protein n=1 Tax=Azospirillum soli TaxID=1304799 RepID=UPI001AE16BDF|nr:small-conductance mechanosensitive channel [Azospirillum soli]